jgi:hypothetical protein
MMFGFGCYASSASERHILFSSVLFSQPHVISIGKNFIELEWSVFHAILVLCVVASRHMIAEWQLRFQSSVQHRP